MGRKLCLLFVLGLPAQAIHTCTPAGVGVTMYQEFNNNFPTRRLVMALCGPCRKYSKVPLSSVGSRLGDDTRLTEERLDHAGHSVSAASLGQRHPLQGGISGDAMAVVPKAATLLTNSWQSSESLKVTKLKKTL